MGVRILRCTKMRLCSKMRASLWSTLMRSTLPTMRKRNHCHAHGRCKHSSPQDLHARGIRVQGGRSISTTTTTQQVLQLQGEPPLHYRMVPAPALMMTDGYNCNSNSCNSSNPRHPHPPRNKACNVQRMLNPALGCLVESKMWHRYSAHRRTNPHSGGTLQMTQHHSCSTAASSRPWMLKFIAIVHPCIFKKNETRRVPLPPSVSSLPFSLVKITTK